MSKFNMVLAATLIFLLGTLGGLAMSWFHLFSAASYSESYLINASILVFAELLLIAYVYRTEKNKKALIAW